MGGLHRFIDVGNKEATMLGKELTIGRYLGRHMLIMLSYPTAQYTQELQVPLRAYKENEQPRQQFTTSFRFGSIPQRRHVICRDVR